VQVPRGIYTEVPEESALWAVEGRAWGVVLSTGRRERKRDYGRAPDA
jgi:hypothetical protein